MRLSDRSIRFVLKPLVFLVSLVPAADLGWRAYTGDLTADPLAELTHQTGLWALRFLCITLAVTPVRRLTGWNASIRFRRMTGLFAFFYASLHLLIYVVFDRFAGLDSSAGVAALSTLAGLAKSVGQDIAKRPFITIGFSAWLCMLPLAITSTTGWIRRLGGKRWNRLHRLVYASATLGVVHYWWLVKADVSRPIAYGVVVGGLLAFRIYWSRAQEARLKTVPRPAGSTT